MYERETLPDDLDGAIKATTLQSTTQLLPEFKQLQLAIFVVQLSKSEGRQPAQLLVELQNRFMSKSNNDEMTTEQLTSTLQRVEGLWDRVVESGKPPRHLLLPDEDVVSGKTAAQNKIPPISPGTRAGPMTRN